jgi:hypothetical protein
MFRADAIAITQTQFTDIPAGQSEDLTFTMGVSSLVRCAFLFSGSAKNVRADIGAYDFSTGETMALLDAH